MNNTNEIENCIFSPDFDEIKSSIYVCPAVEGDVLPEAFYDFPSFDSCNVTWNFILPSDGFWITVTEEMMDSWHVTTGYLLQTVLRNIDSHLDDVAFTTLFGKPADGITIPFMKVHSASKECLPPYGVSLMLSDEVISRIHWYIGDFYAFPVDTNSFYALSKTQLYRYCLDPMRSFENILKSRPEEKPMFFKDELLFYGSKMPDVPEVMEQTPMGAWAVLDWDS